MLVAVSVLAGLGPAAQADPMRPLGPTTLSLPPLAASGLTGPAPTGPASDTSPPVAPGAGLLATRRVGNGPWQALVGERWLKAGDSLEGALVQQVGADRVVLLRSGQRDTLQWFPALEIQTTPTPAKRAAAAERPQSPLPRGLP